MTHGFTRGFAGLIYLAIYQLGLYIVPDSYLLSPAFNDKNLFSKLLLLGVWGRCTLYKYISCWILSEGAATCFGRLTSLFCIFNDIWPVKGRDKSHNRLTKANFLIHRKCNIKLMLTRHLKQTFLQYFTTKLIY